jgi:hypothetical protein
VFCSAKHAGYLQRLLPLPHGDAALFILSSAQVMYAYVMRPETLPRSYWNFIVKTGPVHPTVLSAVRANCRGGVVDTTAVNAFVKKTVDAANTRTQLNAAAAAAASLRSGGGGGGGGGGGTLKSLVSAPYAVIDALRGAVASLRGTASNAATAAAAAAAADSSLLTPTFLTEQPLYVPCTTFHPTSPGKLLALPSYKHY